MTTQTVTGAVARREAGPVTIMWGRGKHFESILPDHIDVKGFLGTAAAALYGSADLMAAAEAAPDSLIQALMRCASLGHRPGTEEFYLIPRKKNGRPSVQGIEGYRGIVERMYRSGAVASVVVREVCERDEFAYVEGVHDKPVHSVNWFGGSRGQMIGVYAYAILTTGAVSRVVILSRDDVMAAREASDAKDSAYSPWNRLDGGRDHPEFTGRSMWWKTAARRLEPWVPTSAEYRREQLRAAAAAAEAPHANGHGHLPEPVVDAEIVDDPQTPAARQPATDETGHSSPDGSVRSTTAAPPDTTAPHRTQAGKPALDRLQDLFAQLSLDETEQETVIGWLAEGEWTASVQQVRNVASVLSDFIKAAKGDPAEARTAMWEQYRKVQDGADV